jgi:hypothetical protein
MLLIVSWFWGDLCMPHFVFFFKKYISNLQLVTSAFVKLSPDTKDRHIYNLYKKYRYWPSHGSLSTGEITAAFNKLTSCGPSSVRYYLIHNILPRYSWNTAKVGIKHQSVNKSIILKKRIELFWNKEYLWYLDYGVWHHFQQYFSYIVVVTKLGLFMEENELSGEDHWPVASHWQTLSHHVVHLALIEI